MCSFLLLVGGSKGIASYLKKSTVVKCMHAAMISCIALVPKAIYTRNNDSEIYL